MKHLRLPAAIAALLTLISCATTVSTPPETPESYACTTERVLQGGRLIVRADIDAAGGEPWYRSWWETPPRRPGVHVQIAWAALGPPSHWPNITFYFASARPTGPVRLELRRGEGGSYGRESLADSGVYYPTYRYRHERRAFYETERGLPWQRVTALLSEPGELWAVLVRQDGQAMAAELLDRSLFAIPEEALVSAQRELQAMVADFRVRCQPIGPIIIT